MQARLGKNCVGIEFKCKCSQLLGEQSDRHEYHCTNCDSVTDCDNLDEFSQHKVNVFGAKNVLSRRLLLKMSRTALRENYQGPTRTALRENCQGPTRTAQQGIMEDPTREVLLENLTEAAMNISRRSRRDRTFFAPKTFTLCCENSSRLSQSVTESQFVQWYSCRSLCSPSNCEHLHLNSIPTQFFPNLACIKSHMSHLSMCLVINSL
jgi:hypothetical protein